MIGGVEVKVEEDMYYSDPKSEPSLVINFKKGIYKLNGEDTLKYWRYREKTRGNLGRIERQQEFIKAFIKQSINIKIFNVVDILKENVEVTFDVKDIISCLTQLQKINEENIKFITLPGIPKYIDGISFYIHDTLETKKLILDIYTL